MFPLKSVEFAKSLVAPLAALLAARPPMAPLDGEHSRGKIVFSDGIMFDFDSGEARKVTATDRQFFRVKFPFQPFQPSNNCGVFSKMETWIKENYNQKSACFEDTELGRSIIKDLTELAKECGVLAVLRGIWGWETVLHFLRSLTATALATCEKSFIPYFFGPPCASKDVVAMLAYTFMNGDRDGLHSALPEGFQGIADDTLGFAVLHSEDARFSEFTVIISKKRKRRITKMLAGRQNCKKICKINSKNVK